MKEKNIPYEPWQEQKCRPEEKNNYRYTLSAKVVEKPKNEKILVVMGINPSTADDKNKDATICNVEKLTIVNKYDRFVMINVYPQRATDADNLPKNGYEEPEQINQNMAEIYKCVKGSSCRDILLAYGTHIDDRKYLVTCLKKIIQQLEDLHPNYKYIAKTKDGHPCHPLFPGNCKEYPAQYLGDSYKIRDFDDLEDYLNNL